MTTIAASDAQTTKAQAVSAAGSTGMTADFNMFLKLLTVQMQNQDPLDPMKTSEYTSQLVSYSQVEQSLKQTSALNDILTSLASQGMAQASQMIGKEATFGTAVSGLSEAPARWAYEVGEGATSMTLSIMDASGKTVRRIDADPATALNGFAWSGVKDDGTMAPQGAYTLKVTATDATGTDVPVTVNGVGAIVDVVMDGGEVMLGIGGTRLPLKDLLAVANPAP